MLTESYDKKESSIVHRTNNIISVIIPYKEPTPYLTETLNSLRKQSIFNELDIILVKDQGEGVSATRNEGIAKAKGEFLYFIDADDVVFGEKMLESARSVLNNNREISFVFGDLIVGDSDLTPITYYKTPRFDGEYLAGFLLSGGMVILLAILFRNDETIFFNKTFSYCEDLDYILRRTYNNVGTYLQYPFGIYRQHHQSISMERTSGKAKMIQMTINVYKRFLLEIQKAHEHDRYYKKVIARQYLKITHMLHRLYYRKEALTTLLHALRYFPYCISKKLFRVMTEFCIPIFIAKTIRSVLVARNKNLFTKNAD